MRRSSRSAWFCTQDSAGDGLSADEVAAQGRTGGEATATETLGVHVAGRPGCGVQPRFLADGLAGLNSKHARLSLQSSEKASVLTGIDPEGPARSSRSADAGAPQPVRSPDWG